MKTAALLDELVLFISHVEVYKTFIRKQYEVCYLWHSSNTLKFAVNRLKVKGHTFEAANPKADNGRQLYLPSYVQEPTELYDAAQSLVNVYLQTEPTFLAAQVILVRINPPYLTLSRY